MDHVADGLVSRTGPPILGSNCRVVNIRDAITQRGCHRYSGTALSVLSEATVELFPLPHIVVDLRGVNR